MDKSNNALLVIDVQVGFSSPYWGKRNNPLAEKNIAFLLQQFRKNNLPVIHIQHLSTNPQSPLFTKEGQKFKKEAEPLANEKIFTKHVNSAFIGTDLEQYLRNEKISQLVVVGLTTDHCVATSVRMAGNLGFAVELVADATACFERKSYTGDKIFSAAEIHQIHLSSMNEEFCNVIDTQDLIL